MDAERPACMPTQSVGTITTGVLGSLIVPTLRVVMPPVTLSVTVWTLGVLARSNSL